MHLRIINFGFISIKNQRARFIIKAHGCVQQTDHPELKLKVVSNIPVGFTIPKKDCKDRGVIIED